jgi:hypothetical protein
MTVLHVFFHDVTLTQHDTPADSDSEFDFGSGTEYADDDEGENLMEIMSRGSISSIEESSDEQSNSVSPKSRSSTSTVAESNSSAMDVDMPDSPIQLSDDNLSIDSLEYLGHLARFSVDLDWALIEIRNQPVFAGISELKSSEQHPDPKDFFSDTQVMVHTCHGLISGLLSDCATYMRLPNSASFEEVYEVALSQPLHWDDYTIRPYRIELRRKNHCLCDSGCPSISRFENRLAYAFVTSGGGEAETEEAHRTLDGSEEL